MINVKNGTTVKGDGTHDDQPGLQAMINNQQGALYFPPGRYRINSTLTFPQRTGHHLVGCGMAQATGSDEHTGARAAIVWGGGANCDGIMIDYRGTGLVWDGLTLWGKDPDGTTAQAQVGIRICPGCSSPCSSSSSGDGPVALPAGKIWFPAIMINNCDTGILAQGSIPAASCAFGYLLVRDCGVGLELNGTGATMFTIRSLLAAGGLADKTVFKATNAGRIYAAGVNILEGVGKVLDVVGGDIDNGFYHIDTLSIDGGSTDVTLLENVDSGNGLTHVRFTNMHFAHTGGTSPITKINIDRTRPGGSTGQTVVELVGSRGLTLGGRLTDNVTIKGASSSKRSRLMIRDSEIARFPGTPPASQLMKQPDSSNYTEHRIANWVFDAGLQLNEVESG